LQEPELLTDEKLPVLALFRSRNQKTVSQYTPARLAGAQEVGEQLAGGFLGLRVGEPSSKPLPLSAIEWLIPRPLA